MITKVFSRILGMQPSIPKLRTLITRESAIGGQLFGPIPAGHRREFFNLDHDTWVWHEEWVDVDGKRQSLTTRYEIQAHGILKIQDGQRYSYLKGAEAKNLLKAMHTYYERTSREIYGKEPKKLYI